MAHGRVVFKGWCMYRCVCSSNVVGSVNVQVNVVVTYTHLQCKGSRAVLRKRVTLHTMSTVSGQGGRDMAMIVQPKTAKM